MAIATTSFLTYGDLTDSVGAIDLREIDLVSTYYDLYYAVSDVYDIRQTGSGHFVGYFPGGSFDATGTLGSTSATIRSIDVQWADQSLHAEGAVVIRSTGGFSGYLSNLSFTSPELSFEVQGRVGTSASTASITSLSLTIGGLSYRVDGNVQVDIGTGAMNGTITAISLDDGVHDAAVNRLKLSIADFISMTPEESMALMFSGKDILTAAGNAVELAGFGGKDKLTGGLGADDFVFDHAPNLLTNVDTIVDFSAAQGDRIVLDGAIFTEETLVILDKLASKVDIEGNAFDAATYVGLVYVQATGRLYYDNSESGAGALVAKLVGAPELSGEAISLLAPV